MELKDSISSDVRREQLLAELKKLKKTEQRYLHLFENNHAAILEVDSEGLIFRANKQALSAVFDPTVKNLVGRSLFELLPDRAESLRTRMASVLTSGEKHSYQDKVEGQDGPRWYRTVFDPVRHPETDELGVSITSLDITGVVSAKLNLRRNQDYLHSLVDAIQDPLLVVSLERRILFANKASVHLCHRNPVGLQLDEALGDWLGAESLDPLRALIQWAPDEHPKRTRSISVGLNSPQRGQRWKEITASPITDENGVVVEAVMMIRDISDRMTAMEALQASEERLKLSLQGARLGTWDWQVTTGRIITNDRWAEMLGYEPGTFEYDIGTWETLLHPDDRERAVSTLQAHLDGESRYYSSENRLKHRDGHWIWVLDTGRVILRDPDGKPLRATGVHLDITERKRIESDLLESQRRLHHLEHANVIAWEMDLSTECFTYVSPQAETLLGYPIDQWLQKNFWRDHIHPADCEEAVTYCFEATQRVEDHEFSYRMLTADDRVVWIHDIVTVVTDDKGEPCGLAGAMIDVTTQRLLGEYQERLSTIINATPVVLWALDHQGIFTLSEGSGLDSLGLRPGEMVGQNVFEAFKAHPDTLEPIRRCLAGEEFVQETQTSGVFWETYYTPRRNDSGQVTGMSGLSLNITKRKEAEREKMLLEAKIMQTQKLESLGVLAGGIAHDFNNLLVGILGNAELALMDLPSHSAAIDNVRGIITASQRAADLARQMLAYSGHGHFLIQAVNLSELVQEMAHLLEVAISKEVIIRYDLGRDLPPVEVDITQIRQVIMNLITNASDAIKKPNGFVTLTTGVQHCDTAFLRTTHSDDGLPEGEYVFFEVMDNGFGMDDATQFRIFDPFFSTKETGRGLGLAATLGIVRGHRGAIVVTSIPEEGTTIRVLFPASKTKAEALAQRDPISPHPGSGTVLVVDDEETVRYIAETILSRFGYDVITACDGLEALDIFKDQHSEIAAVLLDLTMPRLGGDQTFQEFQTINPHVPVVMASGYSEETIVQRFKGKGISGFIAKPYNPQELVKTISRAIGANPPQKN